MSSEHLSAAERPHRKCGLGVIEITDVSQWMASSTCQIVDAASDCTWKYRLGFGAEQGESRSDERLHRKWRLDFERSRDSEVKKTERQRAG